MRLWGWELAVVVIELALSLFQRPPPLGPVQRRATSSPTYDRVLQSMSCVRSVQTIRPAPSASKMITRRTASGPAKAGRGRR